MTRLPPPVPQCKVPATFSPSQLAFGEGCLLRVVLGSIRDLPPLTAHPAAAIGRVFHKLLEMAVRGEIVREGSPGIDAERALEELLDREDERIAASWPAPAPKLRSIYSPLAWRRKRRVVLDLAERYLSGVVPRAATGGGGAGRNAKDLAPNGSWSEVRIEAPELRLVGRVDLVQRRHGDVIIRDLKTGRVVTDDGEVLPHIERQMRLYGAMAHHVWPEADVTLFVDHGNEREVTFGRAEEEEVVSWLESLLSRLPADTEIPAEPLATPGEACEGCEYRHLCPAYRVAAPEFWRAEAPARMPLDTCGEISRITARANGQSEVTLTDAAGRVVKIFGLAHERTAILAPGMRVWMFGLRTRDRRGGPEIWRHPHNFFEIGEDDPFARAWTVQVFLEGE